MIPFGEPSLNPSVQVRMQGRRHRVRAFALAVATEGPAAREPIRASASKGFLSKRNEPLAAALVSGSATAVIMMTGTGEFRDASNRLSSNPLKPGMRMSVMTQSQGPSHLQR
jgi:hypothetical protein